MLPLGHETWFVHDQPQADWNFAGETLTPVLLGAALAVALLVRLVSRRFPGVELRPLAPALWPWGTRSGRETSGARARPPTDSAPSAARD